MIPGPPIERLDVAAYVVPTDAPESDGTLVWDSTGLVVVHVTAGGETGFGWSYAPCAAASLVDAILAHAVIGQSALAIEGAWRQMNHAIRNAGRPGAGMMAIAAVDVALWDLKAKLVGLPLVDLFGAVREAVDIYGSGGFTSETDGQLADQLGGWAAQGIRKVKMKIGRDPTADPHRVAVARRAIGDDVELFVDANGGYSVKQALLLAERFAGDSRVVWFEEPRPSDDLASLALLRGRAPAGMDIAAGEYGDTIGYFRRMLEAGAVDCLQADATRCGGYTGFLKVSALADAFHVPLSAHCAPQLHAPLACALAPLRHVEYFFDHTRIGHLLFDGVLEPEHGQLRPDRSRAGHGLTFKQADAERYRKNV